jgi:hypothetical protein
MPDVETTRILERLEREGRLTPEAVLEEARKKDSPLREHFTWDNKVAGDRLRLIEARTLIRTVKIEVIHREIPLNVVHFVRDPEEERYRDITRIRPNEEEVARRVVIEEMSKVSRAAKRARSIAAILGDITDIEEIIRITTTVIRRVDPDDGVHGEA